MSNVITFPRKKKKYQRPNRKEGRSSAKIHVFPVTISAADFLEAAALHVAAGQWDVRDVLHQIYQRDYWGIPKALVRREFSKAGWHVWRRANEILRFAGYEELESPTGPSRAPEPDLPPAA